MLLKINTIPNSELAEINAYFAAKNITQKEVTLNPLKHNCFTTTCFEFDLELLNGLLQAVPELKRRPWCFVATDNDVVECGCNYREVVDKVEFWCSFNDLEKNELEVLLSPEQFAELLDDCRFAELRNGRLYLSECVGWDYSGEEHWMDFQVSVYDWVESFGDSADMLKIFVAYLLRFGGEWLAEIAENQ